MFETFKIFIPKITIFTISHIMITHIITYHNSILSNYMLGSHVPGDQLQSETRHCHHNLLIIDQLHHQDMGDGGSNVRIM